MLPAEDSDRSVVDWIPNPFITTLALAGYCAQLLVSAGGTVPVNTGNPFTSICVSFAVTTTEEVVVTLEQSVIVGTTILTASTCEAFKIFDPLMFTFADAG